MKIEIDIDCTPDEARRFLGLPDVAPMQDALVDELRRRMFANLESMDPETMMKTWLPLGMQGLETIQKAFWAQMNKAMTEAQGKSGKDKSGRDKSGGGA